GTFSTPTGKRGVHKLENPLVSPDSRVDEPRKRAEVELTGGAKTRRCPREVSSSAGGASSSFGHHRVGCPRSVTARRTTPGLPQGSPGGPKAKRCKWRSV